MILISSLNRSSCRAVSKDAQMICKMKICNFKETVGIEYSAAF